jgi:hypothetical protein
MRIEWYIERYDAGGRLIEPAELIARGEDALNIVEKHLAECPGGAGRISPPYKADPVDLERLSKMNIERF